MKLQSSRIKIFVLIGILLLSISTVYAETAEEYYKSGNAYIQQGNLPQAISDYTKAIEINSKDAKSYCNRGNAYAPSKVTLLKPSLTLAKPLKLTLTMQRPITTEALPIL